MNTGMPSSGPMIVDSIRKLGFRPEDIKLMINGHAHIDHAGAFAFFKQQYGAQLAVMKDDVAAMESGDRDDFKYAERFRLSGRQGRSRAARRRPDPDGRACCSPPTTRPAIRAARRPGSRTLSLDGKAYIVVFPDGAGFNPGYRLAKNPSYPGIADDYRRTHHCSRC